jgi:cyclic pyranopterin phosphate synthase
MPLRKRSPKKQSISSDPGEGMPAFTHLDEQGRVRMVDVSDKSITAREAVARAGITMRADTFRLIKEEKVKKGNVLETARIAGILAAKRTSELIPLCHPISITHAVVDFVFEPEAHTIRIEASVKTTDRTGVEMEALTAVSVAALTIYDMCKSYDRAMTISGICLVKKTGGKSGTFSRTDSEM